MTGRLKLLLGLLLLVLAVAGIRWLAAPRPGPGDAVHRTALRAGEQGDLEAAVTGLRQAILLEPGNGEYHADLGDLYLRQRRFAPAVAELQMAAHLAPERPHVYCLLA